MRLTAINKLAAAQGAEKRIQSSALQKARGLAPDVPRGFPAFSVTRRLSLTIPEEILTNHTWIFCQAGLASLGLTSEQFFTVVATLWPSRLQREHGG
jgi:hypothetical protein